MFHRLVLQSNHTAKSTNMQKYGKLWDVMGPRLKCQVGHKKKMDILKAHANKMM